MIREGAMIGLSLGLGAGFVAYGINLVISIFNSIAGG